MSDSIMDLPLFAVASSPVVVQSVANSKCDIEKGEVSDSNHSKQVLLARLKSRPLSTIECERIVHRGQAYIGSLRKSGHVIHTRRIDGVPMYVYEGWEPVTKTTPLIKEAYYKTQHWKNLSKQRKEFDGFQCVQCKSSVDLETHHLRYELFEESMVHDLMTLCRNCHESMHECASGSRHMHFPATVTESQFKRIAEAFPEVQS